MIRTTTNELTLTPNPTITHNVSYLSDASSTDLTLEPIIYDGYLFAPTPTRHRHRSEVDEDVELRELLEPRDLFRRELSSGDELGRTSNVRVSFEMQSSDAESNCSSSSAIVDSCYDVLSAQRLALLQLVQVAKLNLDKLTLFPKTNVSLLVEQSNRPELQLASCASGGGSKSAVSASAAKPPIASSRSFNSSDPNQLFFVEYQFPVVANSRDHDNELTSPTMATQSMRVVSKR